MLQRPDLDPEDDDLKEMAVMIGLSIFGMMVALAFLLQCMVNLRS
jgi:hypothetical protein